jgi:hypothetical protein
MKNMNARAISADMDDIFGADCIGYSTVITDLREKAIRSQCLTRISNPKLKKKMQ